MCAFNEGGRHIRVMGTKGELTGTAEKKMLDFFSFTERKHIEIDTEAEVLGSTLVSGHGGGDSGIVNSLYSYLTGECSAEGLSEIGISVDNHMIAFAAEESRLSGNVINVSEFAEKFEEEYVSQGSETDRSITETLNIGWKLLSILPKSELKRISPEYLDKFYIKK
jgi:hypothetical protein